MLTIILTILWIAAMIYVGILDHRPDDPLETGEYKGGKLDRALRAYILIYGVIFVITYTSSSGSLAASTSSPYQNKIAQNAPF